MRVDAIVAGAGIVGVSIALHLQALGRDVALLDRRGPGEETSHGNAGLVERSSVVPYAFPRGLLTLLRYGLNRSTEARYHLSHLPKVAPFLAGYWHHSAPARLAEAARAMLPLIERSIAEHEVFIEASGAAPLFRRTGWLAGYRNDAAFAGAIAEAEAVRHHGLAFDVVDRAGLATLEPHLRGLVGAILWRDPVSVSDPGAVTRAYADLFARRGGRILRADARTLAAAPGGWSVRTDEETVTARDAVVALGPWADDVFRPLGYRFPLAVKRGYHMHYAPAGGATLGRPLVDDAHGYVITPMARGIRLTTGAEFADRDAPPTPVQLDRAERFARDLFPLAGRVDPEPWMGRRPVLPDMRPVIGPAPRHEGLWFAFGHAHHGFTLGPVTGRLLAAMMTGGEPPLDPAPYAATRFRT